ncbi:hypothetical protein [Methylophaga lonarensis]|uniref:hypothetical protein n=1 Tax=Methylophaga lonarensis TaxID=999151 RepID=UPI003D2A38DA
MTKSGTHFPTHRAFYLLALVCFLLAMIPAEAGLTGRQLSQMLTVTLSVFAIARTLNAVISVAQGTEVSIEPMGVGLTLTPGQILDPLNDLIEQFSLILLVASASIGLQKIMLYIGDIWAIRLVLAVLSILVFLVCVRGLCQARMQKRLVKLLVFLTLLRLLIPITVMVTWQAQQWLHTEREQRVALLVEVTEQVDTLGLEVTESQRSWSQNLRSRLDISAKLEAIKLRADRAVEATVFLVAEFVLVMVLLPILMLWLFVRMIRRIDLWIK